MRRHLLPLVAGALVILLSGCADVDSRPGGIAEAPVPAGPGSGEPNLHATSDGRVRLSWLEPVGEGVFALRTATLDDGTWSPSRTIATSDAFFVNWADFPSVIELPDGRLAAHWLERSGPGSYAYDVVIAQSDDDGRNWSQGARPHRDGTATEHGFVSLFPWPGDALGVIWLDGRKFAVAAEDPALDEEMTLRFATMDAQGRLADEVELDGRTCDCCQTDVAITSRGPVVAYRDRSPDEVRDINVIRHVDGTWTEPQAVHRDGWVIAACPVNGPALAAAGEQLVIAWFTAAATPEAPDGIPAVYAAFSGDAGASFGAPIGVDEGRPLGRVDVTLLDGGGALVIWLEGAGERAHVRARRVDVAGTVGPAWTVARSSAARAGGFPRLARTADRVIYAWTDPGHGIRVTSQSLQELP